MGLRCDTVGEYSYSGYGTARDIIHEAVISDLPVRYLVAAANVYTYNNTRHNYYPSPNIGDSWNCFDWWQG